MAAAAGVIVTDGLAAVDIEATRLAAWLMAGGAAAVLVSAWAALAAAGAVWWHQTWLVL